MRLSGDPSPSRLFNMHAFNASWPTFRTLGTVGRSNCMDTFALSEASPDGHDDKNIQCFHRVWIG